jgi:DNA-binding CsgD family transcriptional regulator
MLLTSTFVAFKKQVAQHFMSARDHATLEALASLSLTHREAEVLLWISRGKSNHDISVILGAKTGTIRKHVEHIFAKLSVENRTTAAVMAIETLRSDTSAPKSHATQPWAAIGGMIVTQFAEIWSGACEIFDVLPEVIA